MRIPRNASFSRDGYLRIPMDQVLMLDVRHLMTGMDADDPDTARICGTCTAIRGYTEWVGCRNPDMSIGWDWQLIALPSGVHFMRTGFPRSNILVSENGIDLEFSPNLVALANAVDRFDWQSSVLHSVIGYIDEYGTR